MIRPAVHSDRDAVIGLLRASRAGAGFNTPDGPTGFTFPFIAAYADALFQHHLAAPGALCLVYETDGQARGILMAIAFDHPYGPVKVSKDSMWWIDPAYRGGTAAVRMLDAYESWAKDQKCQFAGIVGMGDDPQVAKLLRRRGYRTAEVYFLKPV